MPPRTPVIANGVEWNGICAIRRCDRRPDNGGNISITAERDYGTEGEYNSCCEKNGHEKEELDGDCTHICQRCMGAVRKEYVAQHGDKRGADAVKARWAKRAKRDTGEMKDCTGEMNSGAPSPRHARTPKPTPRSICWVG